MKTDKGTAGLNLFLSVIAVLFVVGILVFAFVIVGTNLSDTAIANTISNPVTLNNESFNMTGTITLAANSQSHPVCSINNITNRTNQVLIGTGNYTVSNCIVSNTSDTSLGIGFMNWSINYNYTYWIPNTAGSSITNTTTAITTSITWMPIFIVISAIVVLILMIVLIIQARLNGGFMNGGNLGG